LIHERSRAQFKSTMEQYYGHTMIVHTLKVYGTKTTKPDVIEREFREALKSTTFGTIVEEMYRGCYRLSRLGIFRSMDVHFDLPEDLYRERDGKPSTWVTGDGHEIRGRPVDIVLTLEEKPRIWGQTGTTVGYNEGGIVSYGNRYEGVYACICTFGGGRTSGGENMSDSLLSLFFFLSLK
jgi:hypothetical protein